MKTNHLNINQANRLSESEKSRCWVVVHERDLFLTERGQTNALNDKVVIFRDKPSGEKFSVEVSSYGGYEKKDLEVIPLYKAEQMEQSRLERVQKCRDAV